MRFRALILCAATLLFAGCAIWPSNWRLFGTPLDREKKAAAKEQLARTDLDKAAQRAVHQTGIALETAKAQAPDVKAIDVARDFNSEAQALIDQAHPPAVVDQDAWRRVVADVLAGSAKEREAQAAEVRALSVKLSKTEEAHARTLGQVAQYAQENAGLADWVRKLAWFAIAIVVFIVGNHLLGIAAHLNPGSALLGGASTAMSSMLSFGSVLAVNRAKDALQRVGAGLALVRQKLPAVAAEVTSYIDATTANNPHAQTEIAAGATALANPPSA